MLVLPKFTRTLALRATAGISVSIAWHFLQFHPTVRRSENLTIAEMRFPSIALLAAASSFLSFATAHNIQMKAHQRECFHESLHKDDKMTVTFQVGDREFGGSGNLEIDFWVRL